jgi:hypothetical protein
MVNDHQRQHLSSLWVDIFGPPLLQRKNDRFLLPSQLPADCSLQVLSPLNVWLQRCFRGRTDGHLPAWYQQDGRLPDYHLPQDVRRFSAFS